MKTLKIILSIFTLVIAITILVITVARPKVVSETPKNIGVGGGTVLTFTLIDVGMNYNSVIGEVISLDGGDNLATFSVKGDAENGSIVGLSGLITGGSGYSAGVTYTTTSTGGGSGATIRVDSVTGGGANTNNFFSFFN